MNCMDFYVAEKVQILNIIFGKKSIFIYNYLQLGKKIQFLTSVYLKLNEI